MANYKIFIKPSAIKELEKIPEKDLKKITNKILSLEKDPRPVGNEKLSGKELYRFRQGKYRVIYTIDDQEKKIIIFKIGHRKDVYKK